MIHIQINYLVTSPNEKEIIRKILNQPVSQNAINAKILTHLTHYVSDDLDDLYDIKAVEDKRGKIIFPMPVGEALVNNGNGELSFLCPVILLPDAYVLASKNQDPTDPETQAKTYVYKAGGNE